MASLFLGRVWYNHTRKVTDAPSFLDVPAKVQGKPVSTVEGVHFVGSSELLYAHSIFAGPFSRCDIQPCPTDTEVACEVSPPSQVDLFQDG